MPHEVQDCEAQVRTYGQCIVTMHTSDEIRSLVVSDKFVGTVEDAGTRSGVDSMMITKRRSTESAMSRNRAARRSQIRHKFPELRNGLLSIGIMIAVTSSITDV